MKYAKIVLCCAVLLLILGVGVLLGMKRECAQDETVSTENIAPQETSKWKPRRLTYSPYVLNDSAQSYLGGDYALYCKAVDSILNYDGKVSGFKNEEQFNKIWTILIRDFCLYKKLCPTFSNSEEPFVYHDGTVQFSFLLDEKRHEETISQFEKKINEAMSRVNADDSEVETLDKLYYRVSTTMDAGESTGLLYDSIMNGKGSDKDSAQYLELLLNHVGIECMTAFSIDQEHDEPGSFWVVAKLDGQYYHFDPFLQQTFETWYWFGVGDTLRHNSLGHDWIEMIMTGENPEKLQLPIDCIRIYGCWDDAKGTYTEVPACPNSYCSNTRGPNSRPSEWQ